MLVLDTSQQQNWREAAKAEANAAFRREALVSDIRSNTITVESDAGRDVSCLLAQMGRPLASSEVQRRLHLCNPNLIFRRSINHPELTGIYIEKSERTPSGGWTKRKVHLCGMESGIMPEFSVLHKTKKRVANPDLLGNTDYKREIDWLYVDTVEGETRGWRTVLVRLLHLEILTTADVEKHFGWVPSRDSRKWAEAMKS